MKIRKKKVFVTPAGDLYIVQCVEFKANQYVYQYEFPLKCKPSFSAMLGGSPKSLGMRCIGAL